MMLFSHPTIEPRFQRKKINLKQKISFAMAFVLSLSLLPTPTWATPEELPSATPFATELHYPFIKAEASGDDGNEVTNAMDGISATRWSANGDGQYAVFELENAQPIGYVGVAYYTTSARKSKFTLQTSTDKINWDTVITTTESAVTVSSDLQAFGFDASVTSPVTAKYIKYIGHGNSSNTWNSVIDLQVYPPTQDGTFPLDALTTPVVNYNPIPFTKPGLHLPDGTPYTPHTPNPKTGQTIDVTTYGAIPNDGNDDKDAIQAAINAASYGDEVYFPNGTYNLIVTDTSASNILTLRSGVNLRGQSKEDVTLLAYFPQTTNASSVMRLSAKNNIVISNMTIKGDVPDPTFTIDHNVNTTKTNEPTYLIRIEDGGIGEPSYNIDIENVVLEKCKEMAIRISKSHDVTVSGITVRNLTDVGGGGAGYGVSIQGAGAGIDRLGYDNDTYFNIVKDSTFEGPYIRHGALIQYHAHNNLVIDNMFNNTRLDAIDLHGEKEYLNEIKSNAITNVLLGGAIGVGNTGATHRDAGPGNYIHNNYITNCRDGIRVYLGSPKTIIENNFILGSAQPDNAVGIWLQNAPETVVRNNTITDNTASGFWGIKVEYDNGEPTNGGAGMPEDILIENNTVTGNDNGVLIKEGYFITLINNTISGNIVTDLINNSQNIAEVSAVTATPGNNTLTLNWTNPTKPFFNGVNIYKGNALVATLPKTESSYVLTNLVNGLIYTYTIKAVDSAQNESVGQTVSGTPKDPAATTVKVLPVADTYVEALSGTGSRNVADYGSGTLTNYKQLKTKNQSTTKRVTLMKFDISGQSNIGSITLNLATGFGTISDTSPGNTSVTVYGMPINDWQENQLSWNLANEKGFFSETGVIAPLPAQATSGNSLIVNPAAINLGTIEVDSTTKHYNLDITPYAKANPIFTLMFVGPYNNGANFNILSKENTGEDNQSGLLISSLIMPTPDEMLANDKRKLTFASIRKANTALDSITSDLLLPNIGEMNSTITWQSSNEAVVSNEGVVTRPTQAEGNQAVTLTATLSNGGQTATLTFDITVLAQGATPPIPQEGQPIVNTVYAGATAVSGSGKTGATIKVTFPGSQTVTTTVVSQFWSLNVPTGVTLAAGDSISTTQTPVGETESNAVVSTVLAARGNAPMSIERGAAISPLYKKGTTDTNLAEGDVAEFLDTFYMPTIVPLPYLYNDNEALVTPGVISSGSNAFKDDSVSVNERDDKTLKFGDIKDTVSSSKNQSTYFKIDATNFKDLTFGIRFKQKATGTLTTTSKVSAILEYSVDGGQTYQEIRIMNNRGGSGASPTDPSNAEYKPYYTPIGDNDKDYTKVWNMLNKKPEEQWQQGEDAYNIKLEGANNLADVRVRIRTCIYENDPTAQEAHNADINAISNGNYIAFDQLLVRGTYSPAPPVNPTGVTMVPQTLTLFQNQTNQLLATVLPTNANNKEIVWSTSDSNIATVSTTGLVTAKNVGSATITATNPLSNFSATCVVTVQPEPETNRTISHFAFQSPITASIIDQDTKTIVLNVPVGTDVSNVVANFRTSSTTAKVFVGGVLQTSGQTANNFQSPVVYSVQNISNETTQYTVTILEKQTSTQNQWLVANKQEIDNLLPILKPGDTVVMKDGVWNDADILFAANGTENNPITLKAQTLGGVELRGASRITLSGSYLVLDGVNFMGRSEDKPDGAVVLDFFSYKCRMTNVTIDDYNPTRTGHPKHHWVWNYGTYNRIDHNSFVRKENEGEMLRLYKGIEHHAQIDYNYFGERTNNPNFTNNLEAIQVGMYMGTGSAWETVPSYSVIEHNYFYKWNGEIEIISVKAHNTIVRYNTIENSVGTICLRISDNSEVYGNYILQGNVADSGGIRAYGSGHKIYNNYIQQTSGSGQQRSGIVLQAGAATNTPNHMTDVKVAENIIVANNTIVESIGVTFGAEKSAIKPLAPNNITFINNIIYRSADKKTVMNMMTPTGSQVLNNMVDPLDHTQPLWGSNSSGEQAIPTEFQFILTNLLFEQTDGKFIPTAQSPVVDAGNVQGVDLSFLTTDINGKTRDNAIDVGAFEQNGTGTAINKRLTLTDVGPLSSVTPPTPTPTPPPYDNDDSSDSDDSEPSASSTPTSTPTTTNQTVIANQTTEQVAKEISTKEADGKKTELVYTATTKATTKTDSPITLSVSADTLAKAAVANASQLKANLSTLSVWLPIDMLTSLTTPESLNKTYQDISLTATLSNVNDLSTDVLLSKEEQSLAQNAIALFSLELSVGGVTQTKGFSKLVTVEIPVSPIQMAGKNANHLYVANFQRNDKNELVVQNIPAYYDAKSSVVRFKTTHFSWFAIKEGRASFADVSPTDKASQSILALGAKGIVIGTGENRFEPLANISKAEFATMVVRSLGASLTEAPTTPPFEDVDITKWYASSIAAFKQLNLQMNQQSGPFNAQSHLTKEELYTAMASVLTILNYQPSNTAILDAWQDKNEISDSTQKDAALLASVGILDQKQNPLLSPKSTVTRAEAAILIEKLLQAIGK